MFEFILPLRHEGTKYLTKILKTNLTQSRQDREEKHGVKTLRALHLCVKINFACSLALGLN